MDTLVAKFEKTEETLYYDLSMPWKHLVQLERTTLENELPPNEDVHVSIINFNYTNTLGRLCDLPKSVMKSMGRFDNRNTIYEGCQHVHHQLESNDIILGVDNANQIFNDRFRTDETVMNYLIKPQTNTGLGNMVDTRCVELIRNARIICIYGMSIGETDTTWWKEIGNRLMRDNAVRVLYFPYANDIANVLPIQMSLHRTQQVRHLCKFLGVKYNDVKGRVLVNFCNIPGQRNIFTNTSHRDVWENFEHTMALFIENGLVAIPSIDINQLFEPRIYRKRKPVFMKKGDSIIEKN